MNEREGLFPDRLRVAPDVRFAGESHAFDLAAELARLRAEPHAGVHGHRQVTLFHRPPVAHVLFSFDAGGGLERYAADGLVTIQVVEGHIVVERDAGDNALHAGQVLVLNPTLAHAVHALEASAILLTVVMEDHRTEK
jgi:quercetin dioxygenase-like cupin family protein